MSVMTREAWHCVHAQFFDYGKQSARTYQAEKIGKDQVERKLGVTGVKIWLADKTAAEQLAEQINAGAFALADMLNICARNHELLSEAAA